MSEIFKLFYLGIACGSISMVVTRASILNKLHLWLEKQLPKVEALLSCPWCTSHWVAFVLVLFYRPSVLNSKGWLVSVDYAVAVFVMTVVAAIVSKIITVAY